MVIFQCSSNPETGMWHSIFWLVAGALITYFFNRRNDSLKLRFDKSNELYVILQKILHLLSTWYDLPKKINKATFDLALSASLGHQLRPASNILGELSKEHERISYEIDALQIHAAFILNSCLKSYSEFSKARNKINEFINKNQKLAKLETSPLKTAQEIELIKQIEEAKKEAEDAILELMNKITLNAKNIFFLNRVQYYLLLLKKKLSNTLKIHKVK